MQRMIRSLLTGLFAALALAGPLTAQAEGYAWDKFPEERLTDMAALQRGAKLFVNYCMNCHAASYMRFNRMHDIGLTDKEIKDNLIFTGAKVGDTMTIAMDPKDGKDWFGNTPPDLSLITRSRAEPGKGSGADYVYTYLRTFYRDPSRATGWNNAAFPNVAMPNVLWELQGQQKAVFEEEKSPEGGEPVQVIKGFEPITQGTMTPAQFNSAVADLVAYLQWMGEPAQNTRVRLGVWVLIYLFVFTLIAWRLNAAYWRDVK
ncbi:MAG: cytochrome c1 [Burkholderiales bacterium]|nr:cytochrome c1 [Burkholderiales bacterium]